MRNRDSELAFFNSISLFAWRCSPRHPEFFCIFSPKVPKVKTFDVVWPGFGVSYVNSPILLLPLRVVVKKIKSRCRVRRLDAHRETLNWIFLIVFPCSSMALQSQTPRVFLSRLTSA